MSPCNIKKHTTLLLFLWLILEMLPIITSERTPFTTSKTFLVLRTPCNGYAIPHMEEHERSTPLRTPKILPKIKVSPFFPSECR